MSEIIRMTKNGGIAEAAKRLASELDAEFVNRSEHHSGEMDCILLSFERLFPWRGSGYTALTVLLTQTGEQSTADIIGMGGGEGLLNISFGANRKLATMAAEVLERAGFTAEKQVSN